MNPQLKVEEETGQESRVTMSEGRNTAGGTSDGGAAPRSSVTVSTAGFNPSTIQTLVPLVNSVAKSAAQGVQQAVNQQFAAMLQQQQEMLVALQRIADRVPLPGPVSPTVATPSTQGSGGAESVATTPSSSTGSGSPVGMPPASAIMSVPLITQPTRPLTVPSLTLLQGTGAGSESSTSIVAATQNPISSVAVTDRGGTKEERPVLLASSTPPVPQKIAERIWRGQFVAMWELLPEALAGGPEVKCSEERKDKRKAPKIQSIASWMLGFSVNVGVMAKKHPEQVPGLAAYMAQIVQASRQFRGNPWVEYDTHRRMQAAAAGQTNLAEVDTSLWAIAFANAEPREECRRCSSLDHVSAQCQQEPQDRDKSLPPKRRRRQI